MTVTQEGRQREMIPEVWQRSGQEVAAETRTGLCRWSFSVTRKSLQISTLALFRVVISATLKMVKSLTLNALQGAPNILKTYVNLFLTFPWAKVRNR